MRTVRKGHWLQTYTGRHYWPVDPRPEDIDIRDIAHHLSMLCRYTGACKSFYSVAEHSYHVSFMVPENLALQGLMHDATEAYLGDVNRPLKHSPGMEGYREIEELNWRAVAERFGLPYELDPLVHRADAHILYHEQAALMPLSTEEWGMRLERPDFVNPRFVECWWPVVAESKFLQRYKELTQ